MLNPKLAPIHVQIPVTVDALACALCSAVDGGIRYWCARVEHVGKLSPDGERIRAEYGWFAAYALNGGNAAIVVYDSAEDHDKPTKHRLTRGKILRALSTMASACPSHLGDLLDANGDATTGDVLVQHALFGESLYG